MAGYLGDAGTWAACDVAEPNMDVVGAIVLEADTARRGRRPDGRAQCVSGTETRRGAWSWASCLAGPLREGRRGAQRDLGRVLGWATRRKGVKRAGAEKKGEQARAGIGRRNGPVGENGPRAEASQPGRKEGEKEEFVFQFFQNNFKINFECKFNSTWNLILNHAIQKDMQQHECTHMIVNLHLILI